MILSNLLFERIITGCFALGMFFNALLFIPQAVRLIKTKSAKNVSLFTFTGFCLTQIFAVLYGYINQDKVLMLGYLLSLFTCGTVTGLIVVYRDR